MALPFCGSYKSLFSVLTDDFFAKICFEFRKLRTKIFRGFFSLQSSDIFLFFNCLKALIILTFSYYHFLIDFFYVKSANFALFLLRKSVQIFSVLLYCKAVVFCFKPLQNIDKFNISDILSVVVFHFFDVVSC